MGRKSGCWSNSALMPRHRQKVKQPWPCTFPRCPDSFPNTSALSRHVTAKHCCMPTRSAPPTPPTVSRNISQDNEVNHDAYNEPGVPERALAPTRRLCNKLFHPYLTGTPCDKHGQDLDNDTLPPHPVIDESNPWSPFDDEVQFQVADFLFQKVEMSQGDIDYLMQLWEMSMLERSAPFPNHQDMYSAIDSIPLGSAPWHCFKVPPCWSSPDGRSDSSVPEWKKQEYQVWYRDPDTVISNILSNPDFAEEFDSRPYIDTGNDGQQCWSDFMSANLAWSHATRIYQEDPDAYGSMLVPIILGSDKTTVSVATGNVEYHPVYLSIGNLTNRARRAHRNGVVPIAFLVIPHADRAYDNDSEFRNFKRQLYHSSLSVVLRSLKPGMKKPVIRRCPDGHFHRVIYDLAAYIADYPEQVLLTGIVSGWCAKSCEHTAGIIQELEDEGVGAADIDELLWDNWGIDANLIPFTQGFPRADIHEMITSDLLHQIIKGSFKDHLVEWVQEYLELLHSAIEAKHIMDDIDRRYSTGDDSKALMKVYLSVIADYLPDEMVQCFAAFFDFCYLVRRSDFNETALAEVEEAVRRFHHYRVVFLSTGVRQDFNLPRQHAMMHYVQHIVVFGAPNDALTNQRLDKLCALRSHLVQQGLLPALHATLEPFEKEDEDDGTVDEPALSHVFLASTHERNYSRNLDLLAHQIGHPSLVELTQRFLYEQLCSMPADNIELDDLPVISSNVYVHHSAIAYFSAPSDISGICGMRRERIRSTPSWYGYPRRDCAFVAQDSAPGFRGLAVVRCLLFFSFKYDGVEYPCALVHWFNQYGSRPDAEEPIFFPSTQNLSQILFISLIH
ncbi:hypothetical protein D9758_008923 [Tetrapyrgos nigripes]|uniref:C2H2-type domain-containing protein n=1 Tax=Tetrapyrgos nigripes TaxID=182062 RepID=A0A8H5GK84_9AGAR|nr:hypothetical protein D9758_008923 [Tetrapyrgos nigripes]